MSGKKPIVYNYSAAMHKLKMPKSFKLRDSHEFYKSHSIYGIFLIFNKFVFFSLIRRKELGYA
jgi:hypothetical protein